MSEVDLYLGDCLEILPALEDASVDAVITDIPYGTTACSWDEVIPFDEMWKQVKRLTGVFITTASQPFTSKLVMSNIDWFKCEWVWRKTRASNFAMVKYHPLRYHESIVIFGNGNATYNPQMEEGERYYTRKTIRGVIGGKATIESLEKLPRDNRYPPSVLFFPSMRQQNTKHPTQKPVDLYGYMIRTYTNAGDTVCDLAMGSGTTGVACIQTGRNFIGIEIEPKYFEIAEKRIDEAKMQLRLEI